MLITPAKHRSPESSRERTDHTNGLQKFSARRLYFSLPHFARITIMDRLIQRCAIVGNTRSSLFLACLKCQNNEVNISK